MYNRPKKNSYNSEWLCFMRFGLLENEFWECNPKCIKLMIMHVITYHSIQIAQSREKKCKRFGHILNQPKWINNKPWMWIICKKSQFFVGKFQFHLISMSALMVHVYCVGNHTTIFISLWRKKTMIWLHSSETGLI